MEKLVFGLTVALIGMLVVFVGLILLIGCINLISYFSGDRKHTVKEELPEPVAEEVPAVMIDDNAAIGLPTETLIAITTALMAMMQTSQGLVVRHVRRVNNAPAWNRAGREDQIYSRM